MFLTRTPVRVSLFGGGTDYPEYFQRRPGAVIGMTINRYINIAAIRLTNIQEYRYRLSYSKLELPSRVEDIKHPVVREVLKYFGYEKPLDISVMSDLPGSGSGLGSSSAFTVGFLKLVHALTDTPSTKIDLARTAIMVERELLKENVGVQDQLHASFGGINRFDFGADSIQITPIQLSADTLIALNQSMLLIHTGIVRRATDVIEEQIELTKTEKLDRDLHHLFEMVEAGTNCLQSGTSVCLREIGGMLNESWKIKRSLSGAISNARIDELYAVLIEEGAYGAKLCGAGGGGFMLALGDPSALIRIQERLKGKAETLPISLDTEGSRVLLHD